VCFRDRTKTNVYSLFFKKHMTTIQESDFDIGQKVGEGGFGKVFMAKRKSDGKLVAIKQIACELIENEAMMKTIISEMAILEKITHSSSSSTDHIKPRAHSVSFSISSLAANSSSTWNNSASSQKPKPSSMLLRSHLHSLICIPCQSFIET
jgi:serine/threonine protein kinase